MKWVYIGLILVHGLIHIMGFAKAFGLAELPRINRPLSKGMGVAWLVTGLALLLTAALLIGNTRTWWGVGLWAVVLSQIVIVSSWSDAKFGTVVNVILLAGLVYGFASQGPQSFRAKYLREVQARLTQPVSPPVLTDADLASLPPPIRRYLLVTGAVGRPRVHHFRAWWRGRIRGSADGSWMDFTAEQYSFPGEPARFFLMDATRSGLPVDVFHTFCGSTATMRVRLLSLFPMVDVRGPQLTRAETVTLLNDMCLLVPSALVDSSIRWESVDSLTVRGYYTVGSNTISAVLVFDDAGELVNFVSDDRLALLPDGNSFVRQRWSTPVGTYRTFGPRRVSTRGEGRWHPPEGEFAYLEIELLDLEINGGQIQ
jgi:hypothetical protein